MLHMKSGSICRVSVWLEFILHMGQGDLSDRGETFQGVQCVLGEVGNCAEVCVQQTARDFQRMLSCLAEPLQNTQPTASLNHTGQLQLHPAASHTSCSPCLKQIL